MSALKHGRSFHADAQALSHSSQQCLPAIVKFYTVADPCRLRKSKLVFTLIFKCLALVLVSHIVITVRIIPGTVHSLRLFELCGGYSKRYLNLELWGLHSVISVDLLASFSNDKQRLLVGVNLVEILLNFFISFVPHLFVFIGWPLTGIIRESMVLDIMMMMVVSP